MSVTFKIEGMEGEATERHCEGCGKSAMDGRNYTDCDVEGCLGYGAEPIYSGRGPEMNVSNENTYEILRTLLGFHSSEIAQGLYGDLDPQDVLVRLAVAESRVPNMVRPPSVSRERLVLTADGVDVRPGCTWIDQGMSHERVESYVDRLRAMAEKARDMGRKIVYD